MKRVWIALGILTIIIASCVGALVWQISALDRLENTLDSVEDAVRRHKTDAVESAEEFRELCMTVTEQMAALSRHVDSSPLRESADLLPVLLAHEEYPLFFAEAERCRFYLQELRQSEKPLFHNIF